MNTTLRYPGAISREQARAIIQQGDVEYSAVNGVSDDLFPDRAAFDASIVQAAELFHINRTADRIEALFADRHQQLPSVYAFHTAGFPVPFDAESIGEYGKAPFELFPPTDIHGHEGKVSVGVIDGKHTYMALQGRAHPYEWKNNPQGELIVSRPLNVIKELIRRQRSRGENPVVIVSYLAGVDEKSPLRPGDIGIILDDMELGTSFHPGMGPHGILEKYLGARFQSKIGRSSTLALARSFYALSEAAGVTSGPATIIGTPGTTEFQSFIEMGLGRAAFENAKNMGLQNLAHEVYPRRNLADHARIIFHRRKHQASLLYGMGNTFELATLRQVREGESDFPVLALALITDSVGKDSINADHEAIVRAAFSTADRNVKLIDVFVRQIIAGDALIPTTHQTNETDFSLQKTLPQA